MPTELPSNLIEAADAAAAFAQQVRRVHRHRTDRRSPGRIEDINSALEKLKAAMQPIRSEICRFPYGPQTTIAERNREKIRKASEALQRERRKLWKMQAGAVKT
jgi:hypothetical protein